MVNTRLLKEILHDLKTYKSGLVGLIMILIEVGLVVFYPLVANPADIDNWNNTEYWERVRMTPTDAPPFWVSWLDPNAPPPTTDLEPEIQYYSFDFRNYQQYYNYKYLRDYESFKKQYIEWYSQTMNKTPSEADVIRLFNATVYSSWKDDMKRYGKVVLIRVLYTYDFNNNGFPKDVVIKLNLNLGPIFYNETFWKQGIGIFIHRPDGIILSMIPGTTYPKNIYDINLYPDIRDLNLQQLLALSTQSQNQSRTYTQLWKFSVVEFRRKLQGSINLSFAIGDILEPILEEANETIDIGRYVDLTSMIFSQAVPGIASGKFIPLKGTYVFEVVFYLRLKPEDADRNPVVENVKTMVCGTYGLLGTDSMGRDLWSGVVYGIRWALFLGVAVSVLTTVLGAIYGTVSAYYGGKIDIIMQQIARVYVSIPAFPLLMLLMWSLGPSIWWLIIYLVVFGWIGGQFTVRSMVLQIREQTYVEAARALGASNTRIVFRYVFPQIIPLLFASIALGVPGAILSEAGLSFLGLGDPNIVTWGKILEEASRQAAFLGLEWWWVLPPGLAITYTSLAFILFGQALEKIIAPKLKTL